MKRGFSTSEAKLSAITILGLVAAGFQGTTTHGQAGWGAVAVSVGYALSRSLAKFGGAEAK